MKKFFSSIWFKCIVTLLSILVLSGILIFVLNTLLYVSPEERAGRAVKKIYGEVEDYNQLNINEEFNFESGEINTIYEVQVDENNSFILFKSTGHQGYKGGTISLWISVAEKDGLYSIEKVVLDGYEKQTLMSKLTSAFYGNYQLEDVTEAYEKGELFTTKQDKPNSNPITGATMSANAANNAVNCVIKYLGECYED